MLRELMDPREKMGPQSLGHAPPRCDGCFGPLPLPCCETGIAWASFAGSLLHLEIFLCHKLLVAPFRLSLKLLQSANGSYIAREHSPCLLAAGKTAPGMGQAVRKEHRIRLGSKCYGWVALTCNSQLCQRQKRMNGLVLMAFQASLEHDTGFPGTPGSGAKGLLDREIYAIKNMPLVSSFRACRTLGFSPGLDFFLLFLI